MQSCQCARSWGEGRGIDGAARGCISDVDLEGIIPHLKNLSWNTCARRESSELKSLKIRSDM